MTLYDKLKNSIQQFENDKKNNPIVWVAEYNEKDDVEKAVVKLGIRRERHLIFIYFDFDTNEADGVSNTEEEARKQIEERWGNFDTFKWM